MRKPGRAAAVSRLTRPLRASRCRLVFAASLRGLWQLPTKVSPACGSGRRFISSPGTRCREARTSCGATRLAPHRAWASVR